MRGRASALILGTASGSAIAACSLTTNFNGLTGGGGIDASIADAKTTPDASDASNPRDANAGDAVSPDASTLIDAAVDAAICTTPKTAVVSGNGQSAYFSLRAGTGAWTVSANDATDMNPQFSVVSTPAMIANGDGHILSLFTTNNTGGIYFIQTESNLTWSSPQSILWATDTPLAITYSNFPYALITGQDDYLYLFSYPSASAGWMLSNGTLSAHVYGTGGLAAPSSGGMEAAYRSRSTDVRLTTEFTADPANPAWGTVTQINGTSVSETGVTLVAPTGGPAGSPTLIAAYHSGTTNQLSTTMFAHNSWTAEASIGTESVIDEPPAILLLNNGGAILVARALDGPALWASFDPNTMTWSALAQIGTSSSPTNPVTIAAGVCGDDAVAVWPTTGNVQVSRLNLAARTWSAFEEISGTSGSSFAAVATLQ